ncbi:MAG: signal peptidase I [Ponticaulis sp.]|nr:signal peptidase I [Ponticaulis sp.]
MSKRHQRLLCMQSLRVLAFVGLSGVAAGCHNQTADLTRKIETSTMSPALERGQTVTFEPVMVQTIMARGDILLYRHSIQTAASGPPEGREFMARLIALPGDIVRIETDGRISLNGMPLDENIGQECLPGDICYPVTEGHFRTDEDGLVVELGRDQHFVLSDDRSAIDGDDARRAEIILKKSILGRVTAG